LCLKMSSGGNRKGGGGGGGGGSSGAAGNGFKPLGLSDDVYKAIVRIGFRQPTPVQRKALPVILTGTDACVMARTGSGKTAAFLIPLLEKLIANERPLNGGTRALVLSPTRELSLQTLKVLQKLAHFTNIKAIGIHGGEGMEKQFDQLASKPDVIVATPGRLSHHLTEIPDFDLKGCQICILDEADRLIEMGFAMQIRQIARTLPEHCQKVMLSATMPKLLVEFTKGGFSTDPAVIRLDQEASVSEELRISFINCRSLDKDAALLHIISHIQTDQSQNESTRTGLTLIFCATRHHVEYVTALLCASGQKATLVYGTLDQEARKSNIAAFRQGHKPILVVTDVAARGIDIPLIDHVIHYHFPPSAKLFVHRSGRAARAGRIGFCWGLVEPDELPFMVDLHLFLGRRPTTAEMAHEQKEDDDGSDEYTYTLAEMTPEMVHYGSIPESIMTHEVENVRRIMDSELSGSEASEAMKSLLKVCANAMKQYRRTRPEASLQGARRARAILEGQKSETGERTGGGTICSHPLLRGMELTYYQEQEEQGKIGNLNNLENQKKREEFLRAMSLFRPKETVFEAFATGGGKDLGIIGQVDKGRTTSTKRDNSSYALSAMRNMRRQMRIVRDKGTSLVVAGTGTAMVLNGDGEVVDTQNHGETEESEQATSTKRSLSDKLKVSAPLPDTKRRLSRAERRQLKKNPNEPVAPSSTGNTGDKPKKAMRGSDFRDAAFFIEHDISANTEEGQRRRHVEAAMQPSASTTNKGAIGTALRMEEAMLDIVGDENDELVQKQRMMRWDKSKRKYVQTTVGAELSGESFSKRMKLESGQKVKTDKLKLGEVYEKWQKKTNRSIGRNGVFDDAPTGGAEDVVPPGRSGRRGGKSAKKGPAGEKQKTAEEIKKGRDETSNMKMKNMKKGDRRHVEQQNKKSQGGDKVEPKKGSQGKRGASGRWGVVQKNRKHSS
jgi:ATP-dependent RNA helicase DDX54/DBP10